MRQTGWLAESNALQSYHWKNNNEFAESARIQDGGQSNKHIMLLEKSSKGRSGPISVLDKKLEHRT